MSSTYSFDLVNQLVADLREDGFTPEEITHFHSNGKLREFRGVIRGTHEIRSIDHTIDLAIPCKLPFSGAERVSPAKSGVVKLERRDDDLCLDGKKINLFLSKKQESGVIGGHDLRKELEARGGNVSAKVLDRCVEHPELWPESWKKDDQGNTIYVYFWDDIFRYSDRNLFVRYGYWYDGEVVSNYDWLVIDWDAHDPSASLA